MGKKVNLLKSLPVTTRPLEQRKKASSEDREAHWDLGCLYFDGTREQGYGGYSYDGRWKPVANDLFNHYQLSLDARILDVGCAKGFLLKDFKLLYPECETWGLDISSYAVSQAPASVRDTIVIGNAKDLPFDNGYFDLVVSINCLHNILNLNDVIIALQEIQRVSKRHAFVSLGAYAGEEEKRSLDEWAVVATTYLHEQRWLETFVRAGYTGDYWWFKPAD